VPEALTQPTLNGLAFIKERTPAEYRAIFWLNDKIAGQPTLAEGSRQDYRYEYSRVSSNTGIPAVLGWWSHVDQRGYRFRDVRRRDLENFFKTEDPFTLSKLIAKYDISYVYIGPTERREFKPYQIGKFKRLNELFRPVFTSKDVDIYQTRYFVQAGEEGETEGGEGTEEKKPVRPIVMPRGTMFDGVHGDEYGEFVEPRGIARDKEGNFYVADFRNFRIQKFDKQGKFLFAWGEEGDYPGQFRDLCDVTVAGDGKVYVADTFNHRIQIFDQKGKYIAQFEGTFFAPRGITVDPQGRIWVADTGNCKLKLYSSQGKMLKSIGKRGEQPGEFQAPTGLCVDKEGTVYVSDAGNKRVQIFTARGRFIREFPVDGWEDGVFNEPYIAIDAAGDLYITDPRGNRVLSYSKDGELKGVLKVPGGGGMLRYPMGIVVEHEGDGIYVVDSHNHRIRKFSKGLLSHTD
jgi:sugar lactone lactonase YvrE